MNKLGLTHQDLNKLGILCIFFHAYTLLESVKLGRVDSMKTEVHLSSMKQKYLETNIQKKKLIQSKPISLVIICTIVLQYTATI